MMFAYYMNFGEEKEVKRSRKVIYKTVFINNRIFFCTTIFFLCFPPQKPRFFVILFSCSFNSLSSFQGCKKIEEGVLGWLDTK